MIQGYVLFTEKGKSLTLKTNDGLFMNLKSFFIHIFMEKIQKMLEGYHSSKKKRSNLVPFSFLRVYVHPVVQ